MAKAIKPPNPIFACRAEAAGALGIGLNKLDKLIASGELKAVKVGHRIKVAWAELHRYAESRPVFQPGRAA
jgi:excisionase family DNA binding protein